MELVHKLVRDTAGISLQDAEPVAPGCRDPERGIEDGPTYAEVAVIAAIQNMSSLSGICAIILLTITFIVGRKV